MSNNKKTEWPFCISLDDKEEGFSPDSASTLFIWPQTVFFSWILKTLHFADLLPPVRPVHLPGAGKLLLGVERRLNVHRLSAEIRREQRGLLRLPHLLFLHHHPQHSGAHLSLRQVTFNVRGNCKIKRLTRCVNNVLKKKSLPAAWRSSGWGTASTSTGTRICTTCPTTRPPRLEPPRWTRSSARSSTSSATKRAHSLRTSWPSTSAPSTANHTVGFQI